MASPTNLVKINTKALQEILEPKYRNSVGAIPLPEAVDFVARKLEGSIGGTLDKELTPGKIEKLHREFMKDVFPKLRDRDANGVEDSSS